MTLKDEILRLREEGKTYPQISQELNCSKSTINYYASQDGKSKVLARQRDRRAKNSLLQKTGTFQSRGIPPLHSPISSNASKQRANL